MKKDNRNDRRNFLKSAGAALAAAAVPAAVLGLGRTAEASNNLKQMLIFGGISGPDPQMPGIFGLACFQFQMSAEIGGSGFATLSDPVLTDINSHIRISSGRRGGNNIYVFSGIVERSNSSELTGKPVTVRVQVLPDDNCNLSLTIENTPVAVILLPAIQKVRDKNGL
ncbi:MAG: twin-arginine translocation signal domain-containing protein [Acidobacteria bacterium]|nr:twin-arginine translocation signal domain-containing protein [Acidobacteriota bacterium]